jgi:hypothetical protein
MRTKRLIPYFNNSQKVRVIVDGIGLYMTVGQVETLFATNSHQVATWTALGRLGLSRLKDPKTSGIGTTVKMYDNAMQAESIAVQVDLL